MPEMNPHRPRATLRCNARLLRPVGPASSLAGRESPRVGCFRRAGTGERPRYQRVEVLDLAQWEAK
jgi:hypothetical protein